MTIKELREELEFYDDDTEVVFDINDTFEPESITEDRYGGKSVRIDSRVKVQFMGMCRGNCRIELGSEG